MAHVPFLRNWHFKTSRSVRWRTDGVHALYANIFLRQLAFYTFGLFIPLYLIELVQGKYGASLPESLAFVAAFYLAIRIVYIFLYLPLVNIIYLVGTRWSIFISNIFLVIYLTSLTAAQDSSFFLIIAIAASAIYLPLYWTSYRYLLAADSHKSKRGREVGKVGILDRLGQIIGPLLGGLVVSGFGFTALFVFGVVLVLFSSIPPFFMQKHKHEGFFALEDIFRVIGKKENWPIFASVAASSVRDMTDGVFWPIFAFALLAGYARLGFFFALTGLATIITIWLVGLLYDKYSKEGLLKAGTVIIAIVWLARALVSSAGGLYLIEGIKRLSNPILWLTHDSMVYEWGKDKPLELMVARMLIWQIVAVVWLFLLLVGFWFGLSLRAVFVLTSMIVLGHMFVLKKH